MDFKNMKQWLQIGVLSLLLLNQIGCAYYPNDQTKMIKETRSEHIKHCTLLGQVYGTSDFAFLAMGVEIAKDRAKAQAAEIGATHVVWTDIYARGLPYANGRAYYCKH